ncbi:MAG: hypothetical protein IJ593_04560 [Lachnospiraceae bacterium]|nr:hypothetical protein [Lachnospiraceae bacterium]
MKKSTRIVKRLLALFLVVLMSINTFAAVVGDNDGAAFITKAEFDSLKNDFQNQLDRYNSSIDNKIDGAIALYLAGINISKTQKVNVIGYVSEGVLSPRAMDDLKWVEGRIKWTGKLFNVRQLQTNVETGLNSTGGMTRLEWAGGTPSSFKETGIKNINWTGGNAEWAGYCENVYSMKTQTVSENHKRNLSAPWTNFYILLNEGMYAVSSSASNHDDLPDRDDMLHWASYGSNAGTAFNMSFGYILGSDASIVRYSQSLPKNLSIISTPIMNQNSHFVNQDGITDWCNDVASNLSYHTEYTDMQDIWGDCLWGGWVWYPDKNASWNTLHSYIYAQAWTNNPDDVTTGSDAVQLLPGIFGYGSVRKTGLTNPTAYCYPYIGFINVVNDWNDLWLSKYDGYIVDMKKYDSALNTHLDSSGSEHLSIGAGLPICFAMSGDKIKIPLQLLDTGSHDVWIKVGSFSKTVAPQSDDDCITDFESLNNCVLNPSNKSITVASGVTGVVQFEMKKSGYVFLKWSLSGNGNKGGGLFMPPETVEVTSEN